MSDNTLEKLISTLKTEAIEASEKEAKAIIDKANLEAKKIIEDAQNKSSELIRSAEEEAKTMIADGENALEQAARNLQISVRNDLIQLLSNVLEQEVDKVFSPELLKQAMTKVIENIGQEVTIKLPENMEKELAEDIIAKFQQSDSVSAIIQDPSVLSGFTISRTDQGWSYFISTEEVAQLLNRHLRPRWASLLKKQNE